MKSGILSFQTQAGKILQGSGAILREMQNKSWNTPASKWRFELRLKRLHTNYFWACRPIIKPEKIPNSEADHKLDHSGALFYYYYQESSIIVTLLLKSVLEIPKQEERSFCQRLDCPNMQNAHESDILSHKREAH